VTLQLSYYATLSGLILLFDRILGLRPHMAQIFSARSLDLSNRYGYATLTAHIVNIALIVIAQAKIVEKANKCLDFTLTLIFYHLIGMWFTYGFPGYS